MTKEAMDLAELEDTIGNLGEEMNLEAKCQREDTHLAYLLLRATIGLNICIHGVSRILAGPTVFASSLIPEFRNTPLPSWSVYGFGLGLPWVEAILGLLILLGLSTRLALILGSCMLLALTFGSTLRQDWTSAGWQLIYAAIYAGLLAFRCNNRYSLDHIFRIEHPES